MYMYTYPHDMYPCCSMGTEVDSSAGVSVFFQITPWRASVWTTWAMASRTMLVYTGKPWENGGLMGFHRKMVVFHGI